MKQEMFVEAENAHVAQHLLLNERPEGDRRKMAVGQSLGPARTEHSMHAFTKLLVCCGIIVNL